MFARESYRESIQRRNAPSTKTLVTMDDVDYLVDQVKKTVKDVSVF